MLIKLSTEFNLLAARPLNHGKIKGVDPRLLSGRVDGDAQTRVGGGGRAEGRVYAARGSAGAWAGSNGDYNF